MKDTELIERLRKRTKEIFRDDGRYYDMPDTDCIEAADRIEWLTQELESYKQSLNALGAHFDKKCEEIANLRKVL